MAIIIYGVKFPIEDFYLEKFNNHLPKSKKIDLEDPDFSIPLKLDTGYEIWQVNNNTNSFGYLILKKVTLNADAEDEFVTFSALSKMEVDVFKEWVYYNGIGLKYEQYLVLDYHQF